MKNISTMLMIILCTVFAVSPVFGESRRGGSSVDRERTSVKSAERTVKYSVNSIEQEDHSAGHSEKTIQKAPSVKKNEHVVTSAKGTINNHVRTVKQDVRPPKESERHSVKYRFRTVKKEHSVKNGDRLGRQDVSCAKGSPYSVKHSERSVKHSVASAKYDDGARQHDRPGDNHYDHRSYCDGATEPAGVVHSTTVVNNCVSSIVVKQRLTVVAHHLIVVEKPYYVNPWLDETVLVTVSFLNVRSGPDDDFVVIDQVYKGDSLIVYGWEISSDWLYVELPSGAFGWVLAEYTTPALPYSCG